MEKLITIQKREKLNDVYAVDELGPGGANHSYDIYKFDGLIGSSADLIAHLNFQKGPRHVEESQHGITDQDLLEIVRHRLQGFQAGPYASEYNAKALEHIELALMFLNRRVEDRIERNVLGTYNK